MYYSMPINMFFIVKNHWEPSFTDNPRITKPIPETTDLDPESRMFPGIYKRTRCYNPDEYNVTAKVITYHHNSTYILCVRFILDSLEFPLDDHFRQFDSQLAVLDGTCRTEA
jgi:hypothetical protein